ncbi:putative actin filament organization protein app1 protein [Botrytis fragariae]|uniref:Putative actin filament organization protein app1 protein n=1 Tax=Botrytis fragariae TaxID=1964551 RepID=A0A8H6AM08_9HELO|nr:putative actin filament organization protein app1 protein [Botrytis fragariae]KAF5870233.1 putative actin filament organization protein app1 protein [Botrytis fragariae]
MMTISRRSTTSLQVQARNSNHFPETESSLPNLPRASTNSLIDNVLSYLGPRNPFPKAVTKDDTVWLLDNTAYRNHLTGKWEAEFVAAVWETESARHVPEIIGDIAGRIGGDGDRGEDEIVEERLRPFLMSVRPGRVVNIASSGHQGVANLKLGPCGRNGISSDIRTLRDGKDGEIVKWKAKVPLGVEGILQMKTVYAEPEGWAVISDIDDSIKITQTSSPIDILRSTFLSEPMPVEGMPELYKHIQSIITPNHASVAPWFYLSASPYTLYSFLSEFRRAYYPQGTMILRDANFLSLSGLLETLTEGTQEYKINEIEKIHRWLPKRKMIFVGDSTQSDPEAYGEICRKNPGWVKLVLIRKVTDIASIGIVQKNEPARFEKAFDGVSKDVWRVFESPEECYEIVDELIQATRT